MTRAGAVTTVAAGAAAGAGTAAGAVKVWPQSSQSDVAQTRKVPAAASLTASLTALTGVGD